MSAPSPDVAAHVTQRFSVTAERVYEAWLNPEEIGQWMFGPNIREEVIVRLTNEARVGGKFSYVVKRGPVQINHIGEYLELERPRRVVFTWGTEEDGADSRVVVDIVKRDGGCEVQLAHELTPEWKDFVEKAAEAWSKMLTSLARHLEKRG